MSFSSITFLYGFLAATLFFYYLVPARGKNLILTAASLFFYAWGEPIFVIVLLLITVTDYSMGRLMDHWKEHLNLRRLALILSVLANLLIPVLFRSIPLLIGSINHLFDLSLRIPVLPLPIGILFFSLRSLSYTIDLYRGRIPAQKNFIHYAAFVTMFPLCAAGPLVRYREIEKELSCRIISPEKFGQGAFLFSIGLAKQILLAENIAPLWNNIREQMLSNGSIPALTAWLGILALMFQIYFSFSGCCDMARGLGLMLGFSFPQNFNHPFTANSIIDFWQRWHITLGQWFQDYIYTPLNGRRPGKLKTIRNLLLTWLLIGLWHGENLHFILWGLYFGILFVLEKFILTSFLEKLPQWIRRTITFLLILFSWILFAMPSPAQIILCIQMLFGKCGFLDSYSVYLLTSFLPVLQFCILASTSFIPHLLQKASLRFPRTFGVLKLVYMVCILILSTAFLVGSPHSSVFYLQF